MKAAVIRQYGSPSNLSIESVANPSPKANDVLIQVRAVSLNASDAEMLQGKPAYIRMFGPFKPRYKVLGSDVAGEVIAVGSDVGEFEPGDKVMGDAFDTFGCLAEQVCVPATRLIKMPENLSFEQAASLPQASVVAYQGLHYHKPVQSGQNVLVVGAGGGSGSFAIQLAKAMGAQVTGVDRTNKIHWIQTQGADHEIDFTRTDYCQSQHLYDFILDLVGHRPIADFDDILAPRGTYVMVGGTVPNLIRNLLFGRKLEKVHHRKTGILAHQQNTDHLQMLTDQLANGQLKNVIGQTFSFGQISQAFDCLIRGESLGKVIVTM